MILTVKQLAEHMRLSEPRIRHYLGLDGAPTPVVEPVSLGTHGRLPGKYEFNEFKEFYDENCNKRKERFW
jgi:hypothetical protein